MPSSIRTLEHRREAPRASSLKSLRLLVQPVRGISDGAERARWIADGGRDRGAQTRFWSTSASSDGLLTSAFGFSTSTPTEDAIGAASSLRSRKASGAFLGEHTGRRGCACALAGTTRILGFRVGGTFSLLRATTARPRRWWPAARRSGGRGLSGASGMVTTAGERCVALMFCTCSARSDMRRAWRTDATCAPPVGSRSRASEPALSRCCACLCDPPYASRSGRGASLCSRWFSQQARPDIMHPLTTGALVVTDGGRALAGACMQHARTARSLARSIAARL